MILTWVLLGKFVCWGRSSRRLSLRCWGLVRPRRTRLIWCCRGWLSILACFFCSFSGSTTDSPRCPTCRYQLLWKALPIWGFWVTVSIFLWARPWPLVTLLRLIFSNPKLSFRWHFTPWKLLKPRSEVELWERCLDWFKIFSFGYRAYLANSIDLGFRLCSTGSLSFCFLSMTWIRTRLWFCDGIFPRCF